MTTAPVRTTVHGAPARRAEGPTSFPDDQLYMLKLALELQLEALLLALGSSAVAGKEGDHSGLPWEKWLTEDLDLARALTRDCVEDGVPLPSSMGLVGRRGPETVVDSLAARYSAMATVVGEMLDRTDPAQHSAAAARLVEARARCEERLDALLGETPEVAAERLFAPPDAGHYLG